MPRSWRGGRGGRGGGGGFRRGGFSRGGSKAYGSQTKGFSSSSAGADGLVSGNFRRLNMKGKRYLRAPNTSAASVRRRRRAHKNERRLIDRAEEGYDVDPGDDVAGVDAVAPSIDNTQETAENSIDREDPAGENIDPMVVKADTTKAKPSKLLSSTKPKLSAAVRQALKAADRSSALTALQSFSQPTLSDPSCLAPILSSQFSYSSFLSSDGDRQVRSPVGSGFSQQSKSVLDSLLSDCDQRKSVGEPSLALELSCPPCGVERLSVPCSLSLPPAKCVDGQSSPELCRVQHVPEGDSPSSSALSSGLASPMPTTACQSGKSEGEGDSPKLTSVHHSGQGAPELPTERPAKCIRKRLPSSSASLTHQSDQPDGTPELPTELPTKYKRKRLPSSSASSAESCSSDDDYDEPTSKSRRLPARSRRSARNKSAATPKNVGKSHSKKSSKSTKPVKKEPSAGADRTVGDQQMSGGENAENNQFEFPNSDNAPVPEESYSQNLAASCGPILNGNNREDVEDFVGLALHEMGYTEFRPGQYDAVMRVLAGQSTLVVSATGSGKSLCYQLPALLYWRERQSITLVVSPLVSLMLDQVKNLPAAIPGACLHTNMTPTEKGKVWDDLRSRKLAVLYVSPEALVGRGSVFLYNMMPTISFVCIDESHCLSQWSHNFRPSYLQLCKVLYDRFNADCILGLTATATAGTANIVARHIGVKDVEYGVVGKFQLPQNLRLSVSCVENRDRALLDLLNSEPLQACQSIIIYCTRRQTTENIAEMLRSMLAPGEFPIAVGPAGKKRRRTSADKLHIEAYHAGLPGPQRTRVQHSFISGQLRVVVATVAFGMGLDKPDIRAIIHFDMPSSLESYVQEIGRAGRDGNVAFCHVFLDQNGSDFKELRHHVFANAVERYTVKHLLQSVFPSSCDCPSVVGGTTSNGGATAAADASLASDDEDTSSSSVAAARCYGHVVELKIDPLVLDLDATEETISTLLAYLHLYEDGSVSGAERKHRWWLQLLPNKSVNDERFFCFRTPGDLAAEDRDHACDMLLAASGQHQRAHLHRLCALQDALSRSVLPPHMICKRGINDDEAKVKVPIMRKEMLLREAVMDYFDDNLISDNVAADVDLPSDDIASVVHQDVRRVLRTHNDIKWTARSITRLFQGISSPRFPSDVWFRNRMIWRRHADLDYRFIYRVAREEIIRHR